MRTFWMFCCLGMALAMTACDGGTGASDTKTPADVTGDSGSGTDATVVDGGTADAGTSTDTGGGADAGSGTDASSVDVPGTTDVPIAGKPGLYLNEVAPQGTPIGNFNPTGGDWVELYNGTDKAIDLAGYRLANKDKPFAEAHPLPPGVSIAAKAFLIIYFNHDNAGVPVIDDKIKGSEASSMKLWGADQSGLDVLEWTPEMVIKGGSIGRTPDGGPTLKVYVKGKSTPGKPNGP